MATITTTKTYTHIFHFTNYREMGYCETHLDLFIKGEMEVTSDEFDGDAEFEVVATTTKPLPQTTINKILKHFQPKDSTSLKVE